MFGGAAFVAGGKAGDVDATGAGFKFGGTVAAIDANVGVMNVTVPGRTIAGGRGGSCCFLRMLQGGGSAFAVSESRRVAWCNSSSFHFASSSFLVTSAICLSIISRLKDVGLKNEALNWGGCSRSVVRL